MRGKGELLLLDVPDSRPSRALQDPKKFRGTMHSLAYGTAMASAARDYQKVRLV
jgi:hypothetical protein